MESFIQAFALQPTPTKITLLKAYKNQLIAARELATALQKLAQLQPSDTTQALEPELTAIFAYLYNDLDIRGGRYVWWDAAGFVTKQEVSTPKFIAALTSAIKQLEARRTLQEKVAAKENWTSLREMLDKLETAMINAR